MSIMKIKLGTPRQLHRTGKRPRQEDAIIPSGAGAKDDEECFIVCDGMGGHEHGDVASQVVAENMYEVLAAHKGQINDEAVKAAVTYAYDALDRFASQEDFRNMGTTMTCLCFGPDGYLAAHIGDSRIYHVRPDLYDEIDPRKSVMYMSWDHSLVNMMVRLEEITEDEAKTHPKRNVLLKAMLPDQGENRAEPYIYKSADVRPGDYFFMCSDGVNGYVDDEVLLRIIADKSIDDVRKMEEIAGLCAELSKDNYTCWLVPVDDVAEDDI